MAILVTGGAGFIGSHMVERLLDESDERIVCLDNFNDYYDPALKRANIAGFQDHRRVVLIEGTFCDREAMRDLFRDQSVREVVHLGAYAGVRPSVADPLPYQKSNVEGTLCLLEAARDYPVERFLLASSSTVYGEGVDVPFREDAPLGIPISPYGATKRAAELLGLTYHLLHGVPVVCLRPFSVYGPRLRPDLAMSIFTGKMLRGEPVPLFGDGSIRRDFTHIRDICDGILAALSAENVVGETINLGHNEPVEMRRLIEMLAEAIGKPAKIDYQPEKPGEMAVTCADLTKAARLLGYQPKVPLDEGIAEYVAWHRRVHGDS